MGGKMNWDGARRWQAARQAEHDDALRRMARPAKAFRANYNGTRCARCHRTILKGQWMVRYFDAWAHRSCT